MSKKLFEIRLHARAGQGAWTASRILAQAALLEGKSVQSFPNFGPERRGAPMVAFARISDDKIMVHSDIQNPDVVAVLDPTLLKTQPVTSGIAQDGVIVVNTTKPPSTVKKDLGLENTNVQVFSVPASDIAIEKLGRDITNTAIIGAIIKATGIIKLTSLTKIVRELLAGKKVEENLKVIEEAYREAHN
ncbi:MAG: 2-oxoacid:acceptor oxidoreductase family protein [Candidatus Ranarchaeia archaeon]